jgi:DNA-binding NtrC family response regulator
VNDSRKRHILVVEDDPPLNRMLADQLQRQGFAVTGVRTLAEAEKAVQAREPALAILDIRLPDGQGIEAISRFREICPVIILTAFGSIDQAVQAVQAGAADYLIKPVSPGRLDIAVKRAIETEDMRRKIELFESKSKSAGTSRMVGRSAAYLKVQQMVGLVAPADTTVLIQGESGVGKELVAESIHLASARASEQLVTIDCASLHENLLESELFGHERGAFTGADRKKEGLIEVAEGSTVFLDEIGEISPAIQAKLLRVLETSRFRRLGGTRDIAANVRFVTATNRNLSDWVKEGKFRGDLYYRLSPFVITVPPLRERRDDILVLARHFLESRNFMRNVPKHFHATTEALLLAYDWPGNIRELRNVVERGLLMSASDGTIWPRHLSLPSAGDAGARGFALTFDQAPTLEQLKDLYIERMLQSHGGNREAAARAMGVSARNLYRHIADKRAGRNAADDET